jgi:hypothetical protein
MLNDELLNAHVLHLFLGHFPIAGLLAGVIGLLASALIRNNQARLSALCVVMIASLSVVLASETGERIGSSGSSDEERLIETHIERFDRVRYYYYGLAAVAALALLATPNQPGALMLFSWLTVFYGAAMVGVGVWIAHPAVSANHEDIRGKERRPPVERVTDR